MKLAATYALAGYVKEEELSCENIIPSALDKGVARCVADAVARAAKH
jgi:malate dehydrogenase (oxaloacetate-decarboxylating)